MKKKIFVIFLIILIFIAAILYFKTTNNKNLISKENNYISGTIMELDDFSITVSTPDNEEYVLITENINNNLPENLSIGTNITAYYSGEIMESDPAKVIIDSIKLE